MCCLQRERDDGGEDSDERVVGGEHSETASGVDLLARAAKRVLRRVALSMRALAAHNAHSPESLVSDPTPLRALPPRNAHSASPSHAIFQLQARDQLQQLQEVSREAWEQSLLIEKTELENTRAQQFTTRRSKITAPPPAPRTPQTALSPQSVASGSPPTRLTPTRTPGARSDRPTSPLSGEPTPLPSAREIEAASDLLFARSSMREADMGVFCRALDLVQKDRLEGHARYSRFQKLHAVDSGRSWQAAFRAASSLASAVDRLKGVVTERDMRRLADSLSASESQRSSRSQPHVPPTTATPPRSERRVIAL